jgi:predicted DCC family thiol-disulfide oxidoreductase YuxK
MVFDGECDFCKRWIARWQQITGEAVVYITFQSLDGRWPEVPRADYERAVQLIRTDGTVESGASAVFHSLSTNLWYRWPLWLYQHIPGFASITDAVYGFIARHRVFSSRLTRLFWGKKVARPQRLLVRSLFLKLLALVYFCAFVSLWTQIEGLIGDKGILPAKETVARWHDFYKQSGFGLSRYLKEPGFCWINASNTFLHLHCAIGTLASILLLANVCPRLALLMLWLLYLSLARISDVFLGYQWDNLLLETGFLGIFLAPAGLLPGRSVVTAMPNVIVWLFRWLLFRLMFASGCVKLLSGDMTWRNLTALQYHYETQPLPTALAWYAHQLPLWFHKLSAAGMFGIELVVPFLIFLPRRPRLLACILFIALELGIALTGNYTFFNFLTIALCVLLLDDEHLRRLIPARWRSRPGHMPETRALSPSFRLLTVLVVAVVLVITSVQLLAMFNPQRQWWTPVVNLYKAVEPFRSINSYGLFAVMTTTRPEIIIEGSNDAKTWRPYEFKHKPGALTRRPEFVAPHQPRLDWQMWFAALGNYQQNRWFVDFSQRLLERSPDVLPLVEEPLLGNGPPRYLRALHYEYKFTTPAERKRSGAWWKRELKGMYFPVVTLVGEGTNRHLTMGQP